MVTSPAPHKHTDRERERERYSIFIVALKQISYSESELINIKISNPL